MKTNKKKRQQEFKEQNEWILFTLMLLSVLQYCYVYSIFMLSLESFNYNTIWRKNILTDNNTIKYRIMIQKSMLFFLIPLPVNFFQSIPFLSSLAILLERCTHHNWEVFKNVWTNTWKPFLDYIIHHIWGYMYTSNKSTAKIIQERQKLVHTTYV